MRILYHHRIGSKDGQAVHIDGLVGALRDAGHDVTVVGPASQTRMEFGGESAAVAYVRKKFPRALTELLEIAYNVPAFVRLYVAYRHHRPDAIYERYNLFSLAGTALRLLCKTPLLLEVNAPLFDERSRYGGLSLRWVARLAERMVWRCADIVLPVSGVLAQYISAAGVHPRRIVVIPNGVSEEFLASSPQARALRRELAIDERLVLGFVGYVRDWHGVGAVIDVIAERGAALNLHFLVVGDGPARAGLERYASERGAGGRTTFVGLVPRDKVRRYLEAFDIALQPKVVPYASPLKVFEYMAMGLPIIAPDTPNIREILRNRETALLFRPDAFDELGRNIEELTQDSELRGRLAGNAKRSLLDRHLTWRANAERVAALIMSLLREPAGQRRTAGDPKSRVQRTGDPQ